MFVCLRSPVCIQATLYCVGWCVLEYWMSPRWSSTTCLVCVLRISWNVGFRHKCSSWAWPRVFIMHVCLFARDTSGLWLMMILMMMIHRFVERVLNSPHTCCQSQSNRWVLRCRANATGESIVVRMAAGRLFQMGGPATAKLIIPSVVVILGKNSWLLCE